MPSKYATMLEVNRLRRKPMRELDRVQFRTVHLPKNPVTQGKLVLGMPGKGSTLRTGERKC